MHSVMECLFFLYISHPAYSLRYTYQFFPFLDQNSGTESLLLGVNPYECLEIRLIRFWYFFR